MHLVQQEQASLAATIQSTQANWTERARLLARRLASAGEPSAHRHTHEAPENSDGFDACTDVESSELVSARLPD